MMIELFGSIASPYVRRLRLLMGFHKIDYNFTIVDYLNDANRDEMKLVNPSMKVPMLKHGDEYVFDSGLIFELLCEKHNLSPLSWEQKKQLVNINAANDSFVQLLMLHRSGLDSDKSALIIKLQQERVKICMDAFEHDAEKQAFNEWNFLSISLFCLLDWIEFRELYDFSGYPALSAFWTEHSQESLSKETDPRQIL